jgi:hypothetical protein
MTRKLFMTAVVVAIALSPLISIGTAEAHGGGSHGGGVGGGGVHGRGFAGGRFGDQGSFGGRGFRGDGFRGDGFAYGGYFGGYYLGYYGYGRCYLTVYGTAYCSWSPQDRMTAALICGGIQMLRIDHHPEQREFDQVVQFPHQLTRFLVPTVFAAAPALSLILISAQAATA